MCKLMEDAVNNDELGKGIMRRFGDERSSLVDQFERLSFEAHLNKAILARSLSEPSTTVRASARLQHPPTLVLPMLSQPNQGQQRHSRSSFHKLLNKLIKPFFAKWKRVSADPKDPRSNWKGFSRSMRF